MVRRGNRGSGAGLVAVLLALLVVGCGTAQSTLPPPTPRPTPVITPDPHLTDPTTADAVFLALGAAGLRITPNNADSDQGDVVKRINATYLDWPLIISQYTSGAALDAATPWTSEEVPTRGQPPVQIAGLNILVEWGPTTGRKPKAPTGPRIEGLRDLAGGLDLLLSPIRARSVVPVPGAVQSLPPEPSGDTGEDGDAGEAGEATPGS